MKQHLATDNKVRAPSEKQFKLYVQITSIPHTFIHIEVATDISKAHKLYSAP